MFTTNKGAHSIKDTQANASLSHVHAAQADSQRFIASSLLFREMYPDEIATIVSHFQSVTYSKGALIIERGSWHGYFHIIVSGSVNVLLSEGDNRLPEIIVDHLGPGECFGEMSLITGELPAATVRAEQDTILWSLSQVDFTSLTAGNPRLLRNMSHILSNRLTQTNQHILSTSNRRAELVWLTMAQTAGINDPLQRSLAFHIVQALAERSHKRVCLLEMCSIEQAVGPHFALRAEQVRPSLEACAESQSLFQRHKAPTISADGQRFPALTVLTDMHSCETATQAHQEEWSGPILSTLHTLAAAYDYLLIVTFPTTPVPILQVVEKLCHRSYMLVSADGDALRHARSMLATASTRLPRSVFVSNVPEQPTIGAQDRYAAQLGLRRQEAASEAAQLVRLLPASNDLLERCWHEHAALSRIMPAAALTKAVDFVARHISRQTIGIAFGGGGARGFAHIGVLKSLLKSNIPLDYVSACSIGSIAAGLHLLGKSLEEIEEAFLQIHRYVARFNLPWNSLLSNTSLKRQFIEQTRGKHFEDLTTPYTMVAVDLATNTGMMLDRGPLWQAGLASVALPGIFPPVIIGKHVLVDAGMHDPVPVGVLRRMGADILIASDLSIERPNTYQSGHILAREEESVAKENTVRAPHIIDLLLRSYDMTMATIGMHSIREADLAICPKLHNIPLRQFAQGYKFVAAGFEAANEALPALRQRLPWVTGI